MIDKKFVEETANKWQTTAFNVSREYLQHRFLTFLYQKENSRSLFFKGGTALRILFNSPRFSEDLDFSIINISSEKIENLIQAVLIDMEGENLDSEILESKKTTGGYIFIHRTSIFDFTIDLTLNLIVGKKAVGDVILINSPLVPIYSVQGLKQEDLLKEKFLAALSRQKARDLFDLYFILRTQNLRSLVKINLEERKKLVRILKKLDKNKIGRELKPLLPKSFHLLVKNISELLIKELG